MSDERVYTVQRFDSAEPSAASKSCSQVCLTLDDDGGFTLLVGSASSDWGQQHETSRLYFGSYDDQAAGVICQATRRKSRRRFHDHDGAEPDVDEQKDEPVDERFAFKRRGEAGLVCPIDHDGLRGVLMSAHLLPHPGVF
jgi:hypothetical protein